MDTPRRAARSSDPARRWPRVVAAALLAVVALGLVLQARRARQVGGDVLARRVVVGDTAYLRADPANVDAFEAFSFTVLGPLAGDDALLERALRRESPRGAVGLVVLVGDVARAARPGDYVRVAATVGDAHVVSAPGAADLHSRQAEAYGAYVSAPRWWFVRNGCLFVGVPGDAPQDRAFVHEAIDADAAASRHVFVFHGAGAPPTDERVTTAFGPGEAGVLRDVAVGPDGIEATRVSLSPLPTLGSLDRALLLDVLHPLVGTSTPAYASLLAACALLLACAGRLSARPRPRPGPPAAPARTPAHSAS